MTAGFTTFNPRRIGCIIAIVGRPLTPMSFAGVARRTAWRGAYYAGAAAAVGAAAAYGGYYRPPCGYYPYPPCY